MLGIDFGTASCRAAIMRDGSPSLVRDAKGRQGMPAIVAFEAAGPVVGFDAISVALRAPHQAVRNLKRWVGLPLSDPRVDWLRRWSDAPFERSKDGALVGIAGQWRSGVSLAAELLRAVMARASEQAPFALTGAVITKPSWFEPTQSSALLCAATEAGVPVVRMVHDATAIAATLAESAVETRRVLIVDLGSGGTSASVVVIEPGRVELMSSVGQSTVGGGELDLALFRSLAADLAAEGLEAASGQGRAFLLDAVAELRVALDDAEEIEHPLPFPIPSGRTHYPFSRVRFAPLVSSLVGRTENCVAAAMGSAGLSSKSLDAAYLVGGLWPTPGVREALAETLNIKLTARPDLAQRVAMGAALIAGAAMNVGPPLNVTDTDDVVSYGPVSGDVG